MEPGVVAADVISVIAFTAAAIVTLLVDRGPHNAGVSPAARYLFALAMGLYAFVGVSNVLEHSGVTAALDVYEDYLEVLFVPLVAYSTHSMYMNHRLDERARAMRALQREHEMLMSIVETAPSGIVLADPSGVIVYANEPARRILELTEDADSGAFLAPPWRMAGSADGRAGSLAGLVDAAPLSAVVRTIEWPDGRSIDLSLSSTPMQDRSGGVGGSVIAFEKVAGPRD